MNRDPRNLDPDQIVAETHSLRDDTQVVEEIHSLRDDMSRLAIRMVELSQGLQGKTRRRPTDEFTAPYVMFANTWTRFGAMVESGVRRTGGVTRLVVTAQRERAAAIQKAERGARHVLAPVKQASTQPDLIELYGEEMVKYAAR